MKVLRVTMPDGSRWDVPAEKIAEHRAEHYANRDYQYEGADHKATFQRELQFTMANPVELIDWAENNMNWEDVSLLAVEVAASTRKPEDFQDGWVNGKKEVLEK